MRGSQRHVKALVFVAAMLLPTIECRAQFPAQQPLKAAPGVAAQLQRVQFRVLGGRITCTSEAIGGRLSFGAKSLGREENLTIDLSAAQPAIDYSLVGRKSRISIVVSEGDRVRIARHPQGNAPVTPMWFEQNPGSALVFHLGQDADERTYRGDTFWHLMMAEPELFQEHLIPIFTVLRPGWPLAQQARELEDELFQLGQQVETPDRVRLATLVAQLADDQFSLRQQADRQLREMGNEALSYLQSLDRSALDAEQQFRIRRLIGKLGGAREEDQPLQVARRMVNDSRVWLGLLKRAEVDTRRQARDQLQRILGHAVDFDPAADETVRTAQLAALEKSLGVEQ